MHDLKQFFDGLSIWAAFATLTGWIGNLLSPMAAAASLLWIGFQFYHSAPMKEWRASRKIEK